MLRAWFDLAFAVFARPSRPWHDAQFRAYNAAAPAAFGLGTAAEKVSVAASAAVIATANKIENVVFLNVAPPSHN